jgi:hypothetical protein
VILKGFRNRIKSFVLGRRQGAPVIMSEHGQTTEWARHQAAMNMRADPEIRKRVEQVLVREKGSVAKGLAEAKRRFPECYQDD